MGGWLDGWMGEWTDHGSLVVISCLRECGNINVSEKRNPTANWSPFWSGVFRNSRDFHISLGRQVKTPNTTYVPPS